MKTNDVRYDEVRKKGQMSNLDKKRSLIQNIKRNAQDWRRYCPPYSVMMI
jgi:uncharacterized sporulation protein YeaH/YhbH (DUF444 family)